MKRGEELLILLVIVLMTGAVIWRATPPKEPSYDGRLLSAWLSEYRLECQQQGGEARNSRAAKALRDIGTNALPCLVNWLSQNETESKWGGLMEDIVVKTGWVGLRKCYRIEMINYRIGNRNDAASSMFFILGTNAAPAVPELKKLAMHRTPSNIACTALTGLYCTGPAASEALQSVLENMTSPNRRFIIKWLVCLPERNPSFTPKKLVQYLNDPEREVREFASNTLARVAPELLTNSVTK